jgi:Tfp pilus assembly protein PilF
MLAMATAADELTAALALHRRGERQQAELGYRRVLRIDPQHADALHLLGVIAQQNGDAQQAVEHIEKAIAVQPRSAVFHNNLGAALLDQGQHEQAAGSFRRALAL